MAVWRSPSLDGFELVTTFGGRARMGVLVDALYPGPTSRFDLANALIVDLLFGTIESVTDIALFGGGNAIAVETCVFRFRLGSKNGGSRGSPVTALTISSLRKKSRTLARKFSMVPKSNCPPLAAVLQESRFKGPV